MSLKFKNFNRNKSALVCSKAITGYFSATEYNNVNIPVRAIVYVEELSLTKVEKDNILLTSASKKNYDELLEIHKKIKELAPLTDTASAEEKAVREVLLRNSSEDISNKLVLLKANINSSTASKKYYEDAVALTTKGDKYEAIKVNVEDEPVAAKVKIVLTNKHEFEIDFSKVDDAEGFVNRL